MANIKPLSIVLVLIYVLLGTTACAQNLNSYSEFGNNGKKFTAISDMSHKDWNDPKELERVWKNSLLRIPSEEGKFISIQVSDMAKMRFSNQNKFPTVVYLHGCSGVWPGTIRRLNFLAENGFAVVAPPSFAREKYPKSCDVSRNLGGLYRGIIKIRQNDAGNTIERAKQLPWVDENNVFLMGLSEGGITTATFYSKNKNRAVNARVVEGWTCNAGWQEYKGIRAPKTEPVLTLLGSRDPWFQNSYNSGNCKGFLNKKNGSKSVVYTEGNLSYKHELLEDQGVKNIVLDFLQQHVR